MENNTVKPKNDMITLAFAVLISVLVSNLAVFTYIDKVGLDRFGYEKTEELENKVNKTIVFDIAQSLEHWGGYEEDFINEKIKSRIMQYKDAGYFVSDSSGYVLAAPNDYYIVMKPEDFGLKSKKDEKIILKSPINPDDIQIMLDGKEVNKGLN